MRSRTRGTVLAGVLLVLAAFGAACSDDGDEAEPPSGEGAEALRTLVEADPEGSGEAADCLLVTLDEAGVTDEQMGEFASNPDEPPGDPELVAAFIEATADCLDE